MNLTFKSSFLFLIITIFFICIFFIPILVTINPSINSVNIKFSYISDKYLWPIPNYYHITSYFGKRNSPTSNASSYHLGIDIAAPEGSKLVAIDNGKVTFIGFKGSGGYTIIYQTQQFIVTYHHVSPNYIVKVSNIIYPGQIIGNVGPKNVYDVINNPYKDSNGNSTNGATTGPHLHFSIKKDGQAVNPLDFY